MNSIMLAIKPQYAEAILSGEKKYEFRRRRTGQLWAPSAYLYATAPVRAVVGCAEVIVWSPMPLADLWETTQGQAGISEEQFYKYFRGLKEGFALSVQAAVRAGPFPLAMYGIARAPQSWCYVRWEKVL